MANLARKITKSQWHSGKVGCWLHPRSFLVIIWDYCIQENKYQITFASWQWPFTSLICIQPSELHPILNSTPCRINKSTIYKTPNFFGFTNFSLKNSDTMACWSGLGSRYFVILREHPLRSSNQQPNLPRKKKPKDLK